MRQTSPPIRNFWIRTRQVLVLGGAFFIGFGFYTGQMTRELRDDHMKGKIAWASQNYKAVFLQDIQTWINQRSAAMSGGFFRTVIQSKNDNDHSYMEMSIGLDSPLMKTGWIPTFYFKQMITPIGPESLDLLSVRYWVTEVDLPSWATLVPVYKSGPFVVYENLDWHFNPLVVRSGHVSSIFQEFSDERILFDLGHGSVGKFMIPVGYFPRWRATLDGKHIPIFPARHELYPSNSFLGIQARPGRYELNFQLHPYERLAYRVSVAALIWILACGILCVIVRWGKRISYFKKAGT